MRRSLSRDAAITDRMAARQQLNDLYPRQFRQFGRLTRQGQIPRGHEVRGGRGQHRV